MRLRQGLTPSIVKAIASTLLLLAGLPTAVSAAVAQTMKLAPNEFVSGYVDVLRDRAFLPSPEVIVRDLRSKDDQVRLQALYQIGLTKDQAHRQRWSRGSSAKVIGEDVATPDQIRLTYAALGSDSTEEAVLAVGMDDYAYTFVAVVMPISDRWQRIAHSNCWCKYDMDTGTDPFSEFVELHRAPVLNDGSPHHFELIIRASGGGTGIYFQNEVHFRIRDGELQSTLSFISRERLCEATTPQQPCTLIRRWFYIAYGSFAIRPGVLTGSADVSGLGGVLVTASGKFLSGAEPPAFWSVRDIEDRSLRRFSCTNYLWNDHQFRYLKSEGLLNPCLSHAD